MLELAKREMSGAVLIGHLKKAAVKKSVCGERKKPSKSDAIGNGPQKVGDHPAKSAGAARPCSASSRHLLAIFYVMLESLDQHGPPLGEVAMTFRT
jgi:hypothetical protein